jgi:beta-1,4-N-acetylglucosaminyltransferase
MFSQITQSLLLTFLLLLILLTARLLTILPALRPRPKPRRRRGSPTHILIVLGSGGHTGEMLALLRDLDTRSYTHRAYVVGQGDSLSLSKAKAFEQTLRERAQATFAAASNTGTKHTRADEGPRAVNGSTAKAAKAAGALHTATTTAEAEAEAEARYGSYSIALVPRARKIHQPLYTTPVSCLRTLAATLRLLSRPPSVVVGGSGGGGTAGPVSSVPDLILANGPATSAIVILASLVLRFFDLSGQGHARTRIVYVESFARITEVSLSGKCVAWLVDRFVVQWEELKGAVGGRAEYHGLLSLDLEGIGGGRRKG